MLVHKIAALIVKVIIDFVGDRGEITNMPISTTPGQIARQRITFTAGDTEYVFDLIAKEKRS
jgi:hypothetical protein